MNDPRAAATSTSPIKAVRIGLASGLAAILCCAGPTVLALVGAISAATAFSWATTLYGDYAWWFRIGGIIATIVISLKRRNQCNLAGARANYRKILIALGVAVLTYAALYALTTWLVQLSP